MSVRITTVVKKRVRKNRKAISGVRRAKKEIVYAESDGLPMAENTRQYDWITRIKGGLEARFNDDPNVFVAGDLLWYPVQKEPGTCTAPDVLVAMGRPKGHRGSYRQWEEGGVKPQVVFEIWSPSNTAQEKESKLEFYERYGVEEYYTFDPLSEMMQGWMRVEGALEPILEMRGWRSPLLGVSFRRLYGAWNLYHPNGEPFALIEEVYVQRDNARKEAEVERAAKEAERTAKEAAWAKLRELGIDPEALR